MESLEAELERARELDVAELADAVESIGFECTRCGACCKGGEARSASGVASGDEPRAHGRDEHTATVFPDEVRDLQDATGYDWRDVARPTPFGLRESGGGGDGGSDDEAGGEEDDEAGGKEGETFEWALRTGACGDCTFYAEAADGTGACTVHADRPLICRTYPFSVALGGTSQPMGEAVDETGVVRAHECEGLGRDIPRADAEELAAALKERAVRELREAIDVRDAYEPVDPAPGEVVVHDSEGAKRPDGSVYERDGR